MVRRRWLNEEEMGENSGGDGKVNEREIGWR